MRLINHKRLVIAALVGIALFNGPAMATDVGGVIDTDTTWDLAGSPYVITTPGVEVAEGITLTVEPGVTISKGSNGDLWVLGTLYAVGTDSSAITFNSINLILKLVASTVNIEYSDLNGGYIYQDEGSMILKDSKITNLGSFTINYPTYGASIERNIFLNSSGMHVVINSGVQVYVRNNVFYNQTNYAVEDDANYGDSNVVVEYNSFYSTDRIALALDGDNALMSGINNFWNTTDTAIIESMIYDKNDDLECDGYIDYIPFLTEPHPDTPIPNFNQTPSSECGTDQEFFGEVAFDEVILDGSASSDPDGSIVSYDWTLQHRTNPDNDKSATGVNPTVTGLSNGFYEVCLTVTDNLGATDIDCSLLAAAGSCFCVPTSIHVESITPTTIPGSKGEKFGQVTILVNDDCGNPVSNVEVTGSFSGEFSGTVTGASDANGTVIFTTSSSIKKPSYTFCVDSLVYSLPHDPSKDIEDCDEFN